MIVSCTSPICESSTCESPIREISSRRTVIRGSAEITSVTLPENSARSTARACPAGTEVSRAISSRHDPARRISSFSSQGAVFSLSDFSEFEQTSSAKWSVSWAGVLRTGRISNSSTATPRRAHCHAASDPARPAPMIRTDFKKLSPPRRVRRVCANCLRLRKRRATRRGTLRRGLCRDQLLVDSSSRPTTS